MREAADAIEGFEDDKNQALEEIAPELAQQQNEDAVKSAWLRNTKLDDETAISKLFAKEFDMNLSQANKAITFYPKEYRVDGDDIPKVIKGLRKYRRTLKGEDREQLTKSIETLIDAYSSHLEDCIKSIYWLSKYETPLKKMSFTENDLKKIHSVKKYEDRLELVDII